jgi:hypothetical protein
VLNDIRKHSAELVAACRERGCTPHVSQNNTSRRSAIDARSTRHPRVSHQHHRAKADRKTVRLDQDRWRLAARHVIAVPAWCGGFRTHRRSVQPRSHPEASDCERTSLPRVPNTNQDRHKYRARTAPFASSPYHTHEKIGSPASFFDLRQDVGEIGAIVPTPSEVFLNLTVRHAQE